MDMGRNSKFKDGIRIAAAVYLIYLAVEIIQDGLIGGQMQGKMRIVGIIAVIGFIAFGVVVSIWSVKDLMKMDEEEKTEQASGEAEPGDTAPGEAKPQDTESGDGKSAAAGSGDEKSGGAESGEEGSKERESAQEPQNKTEAPQKKSAAGTDSPKSIYERAMMHTGSEEDKS